MRIAVMGAGGLGGYIGARLAAADEDVAFVARGRHLAAMRSDGLRIESPYGNLHLPKVVATDTPADLGAVDLVLFTVKLWDTDAAAALADPLVGPGTLVVTLQNGIGNVDLIARHLPRARVLSGLTYIPAVVKAPGVISNSGGSKRLVVDAAGGDPTIAAFAASCGRAVGLDIELSDTIDRQLWEKFIHMSANAAASSLMRSTLGPILSNPESRAFFRQLVEEGIAVARATGNPIGEGFADEFMTFFATLPPALRSSMAEDLGARPPAGTPMALGSHPSAGPGAQRSHARAYRRLPGADPSCQRCRRDQGLRTLVSIDGQCLKRVPDHPSGEATLRRARTRAGWVRTPVLSNMRCKCVRAVLTLTPSLPAASTRSCPATISPARRICAGVMP